MVKRASNAAGAAWKKQKTTTKAKITTIAAALEDENLMCDVPTNARNMLAEGALGALNTVVEDRHPMQQTIIGFIKEALTSIAAKLADHAAEVKHAKATVESELEVQKAQELAASDELEEAKSLIERNVKTLAEAEAALAEQKVATDATLAEQDAITKEHEHLTQEKSKYQELQDGDFKVLLEEGSSAGGSEKEAKKLCDKAMRQFGKFGSESALLAASPPVLLKPPQERAGFDGHVLEALQKVLTERLEDVTTRIAANAEKAAQLEPEVQLKTEALNKSSEAREACAADLKAAEENVEQKTSALATAVANLESSQLSIDAKTDEIVAADKEVEAFADVTACFDFLAPRSSVAPVQESVSEVQAGQVADA